MGTVEILNLILVGVLLLIAVLVVVALWIVFKIRSSKNNAEKERIQNDVPNRKDSQNLITRSGQAINSIYQFMEFDSITDNMIVRKNGEQYVMAIECKGINYDLLSEEEKNAVEAGFVAMLNTLRFPIQLYVQTRTLNLNELVSKYSARTNDIRDQIVRIDAQIQSALKMIFTNLAVTLSALCL